MTIIAHLTLITIITTSNLNQACYPVNVNNIYCQLTLIAESGNLAKVNLRQDELE